MHDYYIERFKVNFNVKRFKVNIQSFKAYVQRFKVDLKRFQVTHAAAWGQKLSVSVHFHHVDRISINYRRGENSIIMEILNQLPPTTTSPPAPNPKRKQFSPQQQSTLLYPLLSPLKGKGGACNQLHCKTPIAILPSHPKLQKNHDTFLLWYALSNAAAVTMTLLLPPPLATVDNGWSQQCQHFWCHNLAPISHCTLQYILLYSKKALIEYVYKTGQKVMGCLSTRLWQVTPRFTQRHLFSWVVWCFHRTCKNYLGVDGGAWFAPSW